MNSLPPGTAESLPPGVERLPDGKLIRRKRYEASDGSEREQIRSVSLSLEEAREHRLDYYHPELGWILEGYKLEKDRSVESIMADGSTGVAKHPK